ncbi:MAG: hypothetical protein KJ941_01265 [Bacteroidetes bacterium]|nr:hypothetical protein [Bacteroidota bacterium]
MRTFPFKIFFICFAFLALILFCLPINLFDGAIILKNGIQEQTINAPLSLSYFIGLGYDPAELENVKSFHLLPTGILLAICVLIGIPYVIALRFHLKRKK